MAHSGRLNMLGKERRWEGLLIAVRASHPISKVIITDMRSIETTKAAEIRGILGHRSTRLMVIES